MKYNKGCKPQESKITSYLSLPPRPEITEDASTTWHQALPNPISLASCITLRAAQFERGISEAANYLKGLLTSLEVEGIEKFRSLSCEGKLLYTSLFYRKTIWIQVDKLDYSLDDARDVAELLSSGLVASIGDELEQGSDCSCFELVSSLTVERLEQWLPHLQQLHALITGDDHNSQSLLVMQQRLNPLYDVALERPELKDLGLFLTRAQSIDRHKSRLVETVYDLLTRMRKLSFDVIAMNKFSRLQRLTGKVSGNIWKDAVIPRSFPMYVRLSLNFKQAFMKLQRVVTFFMCSDPQSRVVAGQTTGVVRTQGVCVYKTRADLENCDFAHQVLEIIRNLATFGMPNEIKTHIATSLIDLALEKLGLSREAPLDLVNSLIGSNFAPTMTSWAEDLSASSTWYKVLYHAAEFMPRLVRGELYCRILHQSLFWYKRGHCWLKLIVVVSKHMQRKDLVPQLLISALSDSTVISGKRAELEARAAKLGLIDFSNQISTLSSGENFGFNSPHFKYVQERATSFYENGRLVFVYGDQQMRVEEYALIYYGHKGWTGFHSENSIFITLYGLLMWDVIFAPLPDVFHTVCQLVPLDYKSPNFYASRADLIEQHLRNLKDCQDVGSLLEEIMASHQGEASIFVNWWQIADWTVPSLIKIAVGLGSGVLAEVCLRLSQDFKHYCSGFPDLALFNETSAKLVEVKSSNDRLSQQQLMWLRILSKSGAEVEVLHFTDSVSKQPAAKPVRVAGQGQSLRAF
mmetsp:Transcript_13720/g.25872  ORF Transcript_13720/g.25872 Transcript_13720/m.25872 type:complete len:747 (-) Transcript_13720:12-2252(-)